MQAIRCLLLQQYLPFTVLKLMGTFVLGIASIVATVLTVYGIETLEAYIQFHLIDSVATVLTVYGIETS